MSEMRPYVNVSSFRHPMDLGSKVSGLEDSSMVHDLSDTFDLFALEEIAAGKSQLSAIGISTTRFYTRMLVQQPLEISRFLLQVGEWSETETLTPNYEDYDFEANSASSSDDEVDYFVDVRDMASYNAHKTSRSKQCVNSSKVRDVRLFRPEHDNLFPEAIKIKDGPYVFSAIGALCEKEGIFSMWRALNASCIVKAATGVVKAWITSFLATSTGMPDPQFVELLQTPDPLRLVLLGALGCAITAAALTPLFVIRARLISTSMTIPDRPRSLRWSLLDTIRRGHIIAPWWVVLPTTLCATINHTIVTAAPIILWRCGRIGSFSSPMLYQFSKLGASLVGLTVKMPLETLASRAQLKACHPCARALVVKPVAYQGILHTLCSIVKGETSLSTLYRGWRSEIVGLLSEWGYYALEQNKPTQRERF